MDGGRLPNRVMFGRMEGPGQRGAGGKEKEWTDGVAEDVRAFGIGGDWKAAAVERGRGTIQSSKGVADILPDGRRDRRRRQTRLSSHRG